MRWTLEDISRKPTIAAQIYPQASSPALAVKAPPEPIKGPRRGIQNHVIPNNAGCLPPAPLVERCLPHEPLADALPQAGHPAKHIVRVTSYRVRLLDEDNLCEKFHIDALRYSGLLPSDAPDRTRIVTTQEKVAKRELERTEIVISLE